MMSKSKVFSVVPGRYEIPSIGFVDANKEVSDEKAFSIYKLPRRVFPWISLGPKAASFLKKKNLKATEVAGMIQNAKTEEEVEILAALSDAKAVTGIKETKLASFKNSKK